MTFCFVLVWFVLFVLRGDRRGVRPCLVFSFRAHTFWCTCFVCACVCFSPSPGLLLCCSAADKLLCTCSAVSVSEDLSCRT